MLTLAVLLPFLGAAAVALLPRPARSAAAAMAGAVALALAVLFLSAWPAVSGGEVLRVERTWLPLQGLPNLDIVLRLDGLAWLLGMLVSAIGLLVVLYARYYLSPTDSAPRFFSFLLAFMGAMTGIALSGNLGLLVVFWELTSVTSFLLIGFWRHRADARQGARMALAVTGAGGLCLLAGVLVLGSIVGSLDLDRVLAAGDRIRADDRYALALGLILAGALTKSAQFPFHFWLPHAMAAPTPVSAYLHSATMVKAGVFLLARLWPALSGTPEWFWIVSLAGLATLVIGAWIAIFQHDLKGLLAYSTLSHLGLITLLFGLNSPLAAVAGVFHLINHAVFKASLFMAAGIIDHETGSRDMRRLNGLARHMPVTATLAMVAACAMAGVPLANGFLSKEMFLAETLAVHGAGSFDVALPVLATLAGALAVAYSLRFVHDVFFNGEATGLPRVPHEPPRWMRVPVELLVLLCVVVGIFPAATVGPLLAVAAAPVVGGTLPGYSLAVWHGLNLPLLMSVVALGGGALLYAWLIRRAKLHALDEPPLLRRADGRRAFEATLRALLALSRRLARAGEAGRLQTTMGWICAAAVVACAWPLWHLGWRPAVGTESVGAEPSIAFVALWAIGVTCAVGVVRARRDRLHALLLAGGAGLTVVLAFAWFSAPDLALTQLLVEIASTLLLALVLARLPRRVPADGTGGRRARDAAIALGAGAVMAAIAWAVMSRPFPDSLGPWFLANAVPGGGGTNVVNVILVDFRGFDTLGEITVLGMSALIVSALLRTAGTAPPARVPGGGSWMLSTTLRLLMPFAALMAVHLFLRGHDLPGGGFIAGLVMAIALLLRDHAAPATLPDGARWIGAGVCIAGLTGMGAWWFGRPFLTSAHGHPALPVVGEVPLATAALFDLGVFCAVLGATLLALGGIARAGQPVKETRR